jgi:NAD(P)H-dependent FMN reductase
MSETPLSLLGLCGSLREGSFTLQALQVVLDAAGAPGVKTEIVAGEDLRLPLCDGRHPDDFAPEVAALVGRIRKARALVLATPDYCGAVSAVLKNVLDWLAPDGLAGKVVGLVAVAGGASADGSLLSLREICLRQAAWVVPIPAPVPLSNEVFGKPEAPFSITMHAQLRELGRELPKAARMLSDWSAGAVGVRYLV